MSNSGPIGGYGSVNYNGTVLPFEGELTWNVQKIKKKKKAGRDGQVHGDLYEPNVPYIEGTFTFDGSYTTAQLEAISGATVTAMLITGMQVVLVGASIAGEIAPEGDEAKLKLRFEGTSGEEIPAAG